jgi:hypothetical protein
MIKWLIMRNDRKGIRNLAVMITKCPPVKVAIILPNMKPPRFQVTNLDQHLQGIFDKIFLILPDSILACF